jgi:hypothetical protein
MRTVIVAVQRQLFADEPTLPSTGTLHRNEEIIELLGQLLWEVAASQDHDQFGAEEDGHEQD